MRKATGICSVVECGITKIHAHQMCKKHYVRWWRRGSTDQINAPKGTGWITEDGYRRIMINRKIYSEHVFIAEKALGRKLPIQSVIHHVDGNRANNDPTNLVVCPSQKYHFLLHRRTEMLSDKFALYDALHEKYFGWEKDFYGTGDEPNFSDEGPMN